jgi:EAL domain-containing protein (putative c-di-GMP-specific phosphodiesterase class I)
MVMKNMINELKDKGIKFYLDDFGTGYSNMERIMELPFDIIKFDRSLVIASDSDIRAKKMVGSLASMFSNLDYSVLYEGVENDIDEARCKSMSAAYLQGYKYSRPIPIIELKSFFSKIGD